MEFLVVLVISLFLTDKSLGADPSKDDRLETKYLNKLNTTFTDDLHISKNHDVDIEKLDRNDSFKTNIFKNNFTLSANQKDAKRRIRRSVGTEKLQEHHYDYGPLLIWHGNLMLFGCLVLVPSGMFIARYFKEVWSMTLFCNVQLWLIVHFTYMIWAFMFMLLGIIFARVQYTAIKRPLSEDEADHSMYGWIAFGLFSIQFTSGNWLACCPESIRVVFRVIHWALGFVSYYFCLIVAMVSGIMASVGFPYFSSTLMLIWVVLSVLLHFCMAFFCHLGDRKIFSLETDGFLVYYRAFIPLPIPPQKTKPPGSTLRLIIFLWYQLGAAMAFIPIFITNSEGQGRYECSTWSLIQLQCTDFEITNPY